VKEIKLICIGISKIRALYREELSHIVKE